VEKRRRAKADAANVAAKEGADKSFIMKAFLEDSSDSHLQVHAGGHSFPQPVNGKLPYCEG
jgi:hypothetical protein